MTTAPDPAREPAAVTMFRRFVDRHLSRILRLPPPANRYRVIRGVRVPMRDGVELIADRFVPKTSKAAHTILIRSPYGRGYPFPQVYAQPLAARGFHVIVQSVRGTAGSAGVFEPAVNEAADGIDTVAWMRQQPWFTGRLATIGPSYLGLTQWALMQDPPPELMAAVILAAPHDFSYAWSTGSFTLRDFLSYSHGVAGLSNKNVVSRRIRAMVKPSRLDDVASVMPLSAAARQVLGPAAPLYESWLEHPDRDDPFWKPQRFDDALERTRVPVLLVNGWQDAFLEQTLEQYRRLRDRNVDVAMTIGPWNHSRLMRHGASTFIGEALEWMATHLGEGDATPRRHPVRVFIKGHGWAELTDWPPSLPEREFYLHPRGGLGDEPAPADASQSTLTYDPADPTPTVGGRMVVNGGYLDDTSLGERSDVACFTGATLTEDLFVVGSPVVRLTHSADNAHVDVFVRLSEIGAHGRSTNVSEGMLRLAPRNRDQPEPVEIVLDAIAHRFPALSRIRLVVAGGSHPRFARNHGTGEPMATAQRLVPATHSVHHGTGGQSQLVLPVSDCLLPAQRTSE